MHRLVPFAVLLVAGVGCADPGPQPAGFDDIPDGASGFSLALQERDRLYGTFEVEAFDAPAGADVFLAITPASADGDEACPKVINPVCLALHDPISDVLPATADSDGEVWWTVPFGLADGVGAVDVQAYVPGPTVWASNALRLHLK